LPIYFIALWSNESTFEIEVKTNVISVPITLEQLIQAVKQLQPEERIQVAKALIDTELRSDLTALIEELYARSPDDDLTDEQIIDEIKAVRRQPH